MTPATRPTCWAFCGSLSNPWTSRETGVLFPGMLTTGLESRPFSSAKQVTEEVTRRGLPATFCHVPFTALILEPDGRVGSCRVKGTEFSVGNLKTQTLEE